MTTPNEGLESDPGYGARPPQGEEPHVVVHDRRRIDPETGQVRSPSADEQPADGAEGGRHAAAEPAADSGRADELKALQAQLDERTGDLQRLTAEYANYRKRVERDREQVVSSAKAALVVELLSVLDDVERAGAHGDLTGAFKTVADKLVAVLQRAGLESFGSDGEPFDPSVHEAVQHDTSPDVAGPTVTSVLRRGYRFGDRVVRAALVGVTDHEPAGPAAEAAADEAVASESVGPHGPSAH